MKATGKSVRLALCGGVLAAIIGIAGCESGEETSSAENPSNTTATPAQTPPPAVPAPAITQASWKPEALEELLAPIALYPDVLLGQILAASVNAQEVLDAGNWLLEQQNLQGDALDAAAQQAGFGPAMRALIQFPTVVDMMCQQIDWTRQLGSAFASDQKAVLDAVQRLRAQAVEVGNLKSTPQQEVVMKKENDAGVVVEVKPAEPQVVYVPQYDPEVIYVQAPAEEDTVSTDTAVAAGLLAFGVGVILGNAFHDDYCYPQWGYGAVYYGPRPFYPPAYVYRPAYGPAFRPAYRYAPPAGYRYSYNNVNVDRNVNVNVQNTDRYFNRFQGDQNMRAGAAQSPLASPRQNVAENRVARTTPRTDTGAESWKGQSTYAGARDGDAGRIDQGRPHDVTDRSAMNASTDAIRERAETSPELRERERQQRPEAAPELRDQTRDTLSQAERTDRGYDDMQRADREFERVNRADSIERDNAFSGMSSEDRGSFDRAASARGRASSGQHGARGGRRR